MVRVSDIICYKNIFPRNLTYYGVNILSYEPDLTELQMREHEVLEFCNTNANGRCQDFLRKGWAPKMNLVLYLSLECCQLVNGVYNQEGKQAEAEVVPSSSSAKFKFLKFS